MLILKQIFSFLELLHKETATNQLCAGFVLGMFMGFTPMMTLHWFLFLLLMLILRVNIGATMLSWGVFKILAFGVDPLFNSVGLLALADTPPLVPLWVSLSNLPLIPFTRFNNSIVMGSLLISVVLALPLYFLSKTLVVKYREIVVAKIRGSVIWRTWTATKLYRLYAKYQEFKG